MNPPSCSTLSIPDSWDANLGPSLSDDLELDGE